MSATDTSGEVKQLLEGNKVKQSKKDGRTHVTITLVDVPIETHRKMNMYRGRLEVELKQDVNLLDAYVHFLNEKVKQIE